MTIAVETIERRLISNYIRKGFLGEGLDSTLLCPIKIPGVSFDRRRAEDVAPFTPEEVESTVGFIELNLSEVDSWDGLTTSGPEGSTFYTLMRCRATIRVPGRSASRIEDYVQRIKDLTTGLRIVYDGPPKIYIRNLAKFPPRPAGNFDDGDWRRREIDFFFRRHERRAHAGVQEVAI